MSGATPVQISDPIYPHDYYLPSELKTLKNMLLDSKVTDSLRTFLRGRTFSRPRGVRRFVVQLQSPVLWVEKENLSTELILECREMYHKMFCVPQKDLTESSSKVSQIIFNWRNQINK